VVLLAALSVLSLLIVPHSRAVTLAWDANSEPDLAGYKLYRGYAPGVYDTIVDVGDVIIYEVTGLALGQGYYFAVTAYDDEDPVLESGFSNEVFYYEAIPGGLVGSHVANIVEDCEDPPDQGGKIAHGDGYEVQWSKGRWIIIYDNLNSGDNVRLGW